MLKITKRQRFVISSIILTLGFVALASVEGQSRFVGIAALTVFTTAFFIWSLEGLGLNATLLVLILPAFFTLGIGLFWFLLPATVFTRLPILILYGIGIYALSLTKNIFTVSAIRTIALVRAAKGVGFVLTLFTSFLLFDAALSLKTGPLINALIIFLISFPLFIQGLWVSKLGKSVSRETLIYTGFFSYALATISILLYFWPVTVVVGSIFLTAGVYVLLGLGQAKLEGRLFRQTAREYLFVGTVIFIAMILVTHWRG